MSKNTITVNIVDVYDSCERKVSVAALDTVRAILAAENNKALESWRAFNAAADCIADEEDGANTYLDLKSRANAAIDKMDAITDVLDLLSSVALSEGVTINW